MDGPILVPVDGSEPATAALEHALDVASNRGAVVHVLNVANTNEPSLVRLEGDVVDVLEREGEEIVADARERAEERSVRVVDSVIQGAPRKVIVEYADEADVGLVAMGAHGRRGLGQYFLGTTTEAVVNACPAPVLTLRAPENATASYPYGGVLVPTDGSEHARAAVALAAEVAARHDATLHLLFVVDEISELADPESVDLPEGVERACQRVLDGAAEAARRAGVDDVVTAIEPGSVPREVVEYARDEPVDLIAMGTHGLSGLDRHLLGSFTERVIRTANVPVLTTRAETE